MQCYNATVSTSESVVYLCLKYEQSACNSQLHQHQNEQQSEKLTNKRKQSKLLTSGKMHFSVSDKHSACDLQI